MKNYTEESVENGYSREKEDRTTENKMERPMPTRLEKYWTEIGRGDGQSDVEKEDHTGDWKRQRKRRGETGLNWPQTYM